MSHHRWIYLMIVVVGAVFALGIAGFPSTHHDTPVRTVTTSTSPASGTPGGTG